MTSERAGLLHVGSRYNKDIQVGEVLLRTVRAKDQSLIRDMYSV